MILEDLRREYHRQICEQILFLDQNNIPNNADKHNEISSLLAREIILQIDLPLRQNSLSGQTSGNLLERITAGYLEKAFHFDLAI